MKKRAKAIIFAVFMMCMCFFTAYSQPFAKALSIIASVTDISVAKDTIAVGESVQLELTWSTGATQTVCFSSDNESVATVDQNGLVTGISCGTAEITLTHSNIGNDKTISITVSQDAEISKTYNTSQLSLGQKLKKYDTVHYSSDEGGNCINIIDPQKGYNTVFLSNSDYILPFDAEVVGLTGLTIYLAPDVEGITYLDGRTLSPGDVIDRNAYLLCYDYVINKRVLPVFSPDYYDRYIGEGAIIVKDIDHTQKTITLENKSLPGDINADGIFDVQDAALLQSYLSANEDTAPADWHAGDLLEDGALNIYDLCIMLRNLSASQSPTA